MKLDYSFGRDLTKGQQRVIFGGVAPVTTNCSITCDDGGVHDITCGENVDCTVNEDTVYCGTKAEFTCPPTANS
jgi:hypothetical protein